VCVCVCVCVCVLERKRERERELDAGHHAKITKIQNLSSWFLLPIAGRL
jgi:hypothetical protein